MAYTPFVDDRPVISDTGAQVVDRTRENLMALRDAVVAGVMPGWGMSVSGGTAEQPATILYSKGTQRVRLQVTWGSSGGTLGNPTQIVYSYSSNSGSLYDGMGTLTLSYAADGSITSTSWS